MSIETKFLNRLEHLDEEQKHELLDLVDGLIKSKGLPPVQDVLDIDDIKIIIEPICSEYPIRKIGVFGSYARGQADEESDIDFVIEFDGEIGLLAFSGLKIRLENALKRKIDLVEPETMFESIRINMEKEVIVIYEKRQ
ncbi:nucleotidyltransferase family protein [Desulfosporosinus shakirovi]|uniref:nucleotidyltransferase family protein n=1 Tax=Desulfosporosinus shakirovi TaxID=2885154 RepID=UPI001E59B92A|nr:nucleotidyltransferase domain-containing protein [Desulfosporosinus sp. SRJS8]MCB8818312.1 nucleotidyltransferase domain-containing protein [Desulfosporosinus sp. SRJS8]